MRVTFEEIKIKGKKVGTCVCGKRITRQTTFSQTINPWNTKDGRLKTRTEIYDELYREREEWIIQPIKCSCGELITPKI